ncbi:MAG TPA: ATP-binding protein [Thermoanaerobaculia bacterium]|nr:ATP-binding protein [Thermoanaerobaculia bacterium]
MRLPFLDRQEEAERLLGLLRRAEGSLGVLYGRRRCGKSRLLREVLPVDRTVYYVGDDRESRLQRASLAAEIARLLPGFDHVEYPQWDALLDRWWREAPAGAVLALDELPALVATAPELPSLLQKHLDRSGERGVHLLLAGSSQRMMQGLVLDRTAPLYGRAAEILPIAPLAAGWIEPALGPGPPERAIEAYSVWGGVPRYWELAGDHPDLASAIRSVVLSPLGALHEEPSRLLLDDLRGTTQAASILSLIGQGCHRISEIAARLGKPVTTLSRPLQRLLEMGLVRREQPHGESPRGGGKRSLYKIADPFLRFWFRHVEPNRSRLGAGQVEAVEAEIAGRLGHHVGEIWEELARASVPRLGLGGRAWGPAGRWWGPGLDRRPLEVDVVAESLDGHALLIAEVKWTATQSTERLLLDLAAKAERLPLAQGREVLLRLWLRTSAPEAPAETVVTPRQVLDVLR